MPSPTSPLEKVRTKSWVRAAMSMCGCDNPTALGRKLSFHYSGQELDLERACRDYDHGKGRVMTYLEDFCNCVSAITKRKESGSELRHIYIDGPANLWKFFHLPSSPEFETSYHILKWIELDRIDIKESPEYKFALSVQDWMMAIEEYLLSYQFDFIDRNRTREIDGRFGGFLLPQPGYHETYKSDRSFNKMRYSLLPASEKELERAFNALCDMKTNIDGIAFLSGEELLGTMWEHSWFLAKQCYPLRLCIEAEKNFVKRLMGKRNYKKESRERMLGWHVLGWHPENHRQHPSTKNALDRSRDKKSPQGKLVPYMDDVKRMLAAGSKKSEIAEKYGVSRAAVGQELNKDAMRLMQS